MDTNLQPPDLSRMAKSEAVSAKTSRIFYRQIPQPECPEGLLSPDEQTLLATCRRLDRLGRLAMRCYLFTGDERLLIALHRHIFFGLPLG